MVEEKKGDDVEKLLSEEKALDERKQSLIQDILKQREAANAVFDDRLAKLGYHANHGKRRSHHKKSAPAPPAAEASTKPANKPKA